MRLNDGLGKTGDKENELVVVEEVGEDEEDRINPTTSLCSKSEVSLTIPIRSVGQKEKNKKLAESFHTERVMMRMSTVAKGFPKEVS
jgi:hypothetical protein